ncbi:MAG: hypothetical protein KC561_10130, partial [Myxococcales bacterium]|nr:hypothetical protein [Myxococcales bacterium]
DTIVPSTGQLDQTMSIQAANLDADWADELLVIYDTGISEYSIGNRSARAVASDALIVYYPSDASVALPLVPRYGQDDVSATIPMCSLSSDQGARDACSERRNWDERNNDNAGGGAGDDAPSNDGCLGLWGDTDTYTVPLASTDRLLGIHSSNFVGEVGDCYLRVTNARYYPPSGYTYGEYGFCGSRVSHLGRSWFPSRQTSSSTSKFDDLSAQGAWEVQVDTACSSSSGSLQVTGTWLYR